MTLKQMSSLPKKMVGHGPIFEGSEGRRLQVSFKEPCHRFPNPLWMIGHSHGLRMLPHLQGTHLRKRAPLEQAKPSNTLVLPQKKSRKEKTSATTRKKSNPSKK